MPTITTDAGIDPETMTLPEIEAELRGYTPYSAAEVVELEEHQERRRAQLLGPAR